MLYTGINSGDNLQTSLQKIDAKFQDASIGYIFNNGLVQSTPGAAVQLGGNLLQDTIINNNGYLFSLTEKISSPKFIVPLGTSSQFLKADGSLDNTAYGIGNVTNVSVTTGYGINATITNPTTTPIINITNTAPDQTVVINGGPGILVTGSYPEFTIYNALIPPSTIGSLTVSLPLLSTGGNNPNLSIQQSTSSTDGYLSSTDWTTFNNKPTTLSALTDVNITSPSNTQILQYNGTQWINVSPTVYSLPIASSSILGGVKIGGSISIATDGTISVSTNYQAPLVSGTNIHTINSLSLLGAGDISLSTLLSVSNYYIPTTTDQSTWNAKQNQLSGNGYLKLSGTTYTSISKS